MYQEIKNAAGQMVGVLRLDDRSNIPLDPANRDYAAYLAWLAAGNTPETDPPPTLDDLKAQKLAQLQQRKGVALATMQYLGYTVTLTTQDQVDVQMQITLLQAEPAGTPIRWEIVNNTFLDWTLPDVQALQAAGITHVMAVYANTDTLSAAINGAADQVALDALNLDTGWPE